MFLSEQKNKFIGSVTPNTAWMLFIASLGVLTAFITMMYFDKSNKSDNTPTAPTKAITANSTSSAAAALNALTSLLMTERQLTDELHTKNEILKRELQTTTADINNVSAYEAVNNYLSALENFKTSNNLMNKKINTTDYYNKVSVKNNTQNLLQSQINHFMDNKNDEKNIYLDSLKVESTIRNNEVRSIRLRKGESIWMLAKRAYGSGFKYHKIMTANPQITEKNAKYLKVGTLIRVPQ